MKRAIQIIDSLLCAFAPKDTLRMPDPTLYQIETNSHAYCGYIIFQDDRMIKFRTTALKPVKILKVNIIRVTCYTRF